MAVPRHSLRTQPTPPAIRVPVAARINSLRASKRRLFGPSNHVGGLWTNRLQAAGAGVGLLAAPNSLHLKHFAVGSALRLRHAAQGLEIKGARLATELRSPRTA